LEERRASELIRAGKCGEVAVSAAAGRRDPEAGDAGRRSSKWPAPACPALLPDFNDHLVADLGRVETLVAERKPDDSLGGALFVGVGPQIELGNDSVERSAAGLIEGARPRP
jgi:hypothetical protein